MAGTGVLQHPARRAPSRGGARRRRGRRRLRNNRLIVVVVGPILVGAVLAVVLTQRSSPPAPGCTVSVAGSAQAYTYSPEQIQNAAIISAVAYEKGLPDHAVTVALAAAMQESKLRNLPYGDLDSVGLFQQRPSEGWGTPAQLLDPAYAAAAFYAGLARIPGWQAMAVTDAAQAVQRSAAPSAYAAWESQARAMAIALTGEAPAGMSCRLATFSGSAPASGELGQALSTEMGTDLIGTTVPYATGWRVAEWVVAHAYSYHVSQVSFAGWTWQAASGRWSHTAASTPAEGIVQES